eukprot:1054444-Pelagomonas_calceolata.AAC.3
MPLQPRLAVCTVHDAHAATLATTQAVCRPAFAQDAAAPAVVVARAAAAATQTACSPAAVVAGGVDEALEGQPLSQVIHKEGHMVG